MIELVLIFAAMLIIFIVLFKLRKTLFFFGLFFKIFCIVLVLLVVGAAVFAYFVVKDANDFRSNFTNSSNMFLMKENVNGTAKILAGISVNIYNKSFEPLNTSQIAEAQNLYNEGKISDLEKNYYKIFVIDIKSIDNISMGNISDNNVRLTTDEVKSILRSDNARDELASVMAGNQDIVKSDILNDMKVSNEELKGYLFSYYLGTVFNPANMGQFIMQYKEGNIEIYEQTAMFTAVKLIPQSLIESIVAKVS